ncbi:ABC transporter ATP-binding protein [Alkalihalobacillus sp. LMS39]|uniref:staphylopine uptake ABC transporter ATP-binding protein CntD n=1 Tax=Alkalihalobacillus sp. LMS39 TaxID=2924032 RepID=UPI001FB4E3A6|nr:ABC transporter ATP-binding protein [Alkalihalobacillus sp. LMS39]UOE94718.1 ABC transporter ATP-binding protein [Alkalihalobacillus sp. LMS39]
METLLDVRHLKIVDSRTQQVIIKDSSFQLETGRCLGIVGESGSGKSVTCKAVMRLNRQWLHQTGEIAFQGLDLNSISEKEMRKKRGKHICMIVQNGMSAFDPSSRIGVYLRETLQTHYRWNKTECEEKMIEAMGKVRLQHPSDILKKYPHELSGGMLQRIMIALALVLEPDLLIADEPTTALDAISQYEVVEQFILLRERIGCSVLFISHDLGVVRKIADDVIVMKEGEIVESGETETIFNAPKHEYTKYLISTRAALSDNFKKMMGRA